MTTWASRLPRAALHSGVVATVPWFSTWLLSRWVGRDASGAERLTVDTFVREWTSVGSVVGLVLVVLATTALAAAFRDPGVLATAGRAAGVYVLLVWVLATNWTYTIGSDPRLDRGTVEQLWGLAWVHVVAVAVLAVVAFAVLAPQDETAAS